MKKSILIMRYLLGVILFLFGALFSKNHPFFSLITFVLLIITEVVPMLLETGRFLDLRILFSISWLTGIGLATLRLSKLQSVWGLKTWLTLGVMYFMLLLGYDLMAFFSSRKKKAEGIGQAQTAEESPLVLKRILQGILIVFFAGMACFLVESIKFRFVFPVFSDEPHAYTSFHITGLHYFVVSLMFVHPLTMVYVMKKKKLTKKDAAVLIPVNVLSILVAFALLSKLQLLLSVGLPVLVWILLQKKVKKSVLVLVSALVIILSGTVFYIMVSRRNYPENYLKEVFGFWSEKVPVGIQYVYMYIVNNLENVNMLIEKLQHYSFGVRQLFPVFALSGTKFLPAVQKIMAVESYITNAGLTTTSIIYDAYGDFGVPGVMCFGCLLGAFDYVITGLMIRKKSVFSVLMYIQLCIYMALSFFSTWFSNPTTWFWMLLSLAVGLWTTKSEKKFKFNLKEI